MASTADLVTESMNDLKIEEQPKTFKTMTMKERFRFIKDVITVEPIIAAYVMSSVICGPALYSLQFEKACRADLQLNDTICDAIIGDEPHNFTDENNQVQILIGNMQSWQLPLQSFVPLILILFLGSYSDRHRLRKPFLLIPILGEFFAVAGCILCVIYMKEWSLAVEGILQTVLPSLFGGPTMIIMAIFSYIADVSTVEMRTLRVGVVQIVLNVCTLIAQSLSGILFTVLGYIGMLIIAIGFYLFAILYGFFLIKEPKKPEMNLNNKTFILDVFDYQHIIDTFSLLLKKKPGNNRGLMVLVLLIYIIYSVVVSGEGTLFYLYSQNVFHWAPLKYSFFITINSIVHLIGTVIGVPIFTKVFHFADQIILAITFLDKIVSNIILGLAKNELLLYVGTVVSLVIGITPIAIRSMATKIVSPDDLGKAQSLFGICEGLGPTLAAPIYNKGIYLSTLETFPAAFFYVGAGIYVLGIFVALFMYFKIKNLEQTQGEPNHVNGKAAEEYHTTHI